VAILGLVEIPRIRGTELAWAGPGLLVLLGIVLVVGTAMRRDATDDEPLPIDDEPGSAELNTPR
jgi:cytochrome c-type biogenesis protein CcmH/NrfF